MENRAYAKVGTFEYLQRLFTLILCCLCIVSCASSAVSRDVASNVDAGFQNVRNLESDGSLSDSYQNSSQRVKGAILGGAAGALAGAVYTSSVGVIPGAAVGAIFGASYGSYIDANTNFKDQIENRGGAVVTLGDQVMIIMPSAHVFHTNTANIKPQAFSTLNLMAAFINKHIKTLVKISAYTGDTGSAKIDYALSTQQAEQLERYFVAEGVNARVLYAEGCGSSRLVQAVGSGWDSDNYRIEILFEKLYV